MAAFDDWVARFPSFVGQKGQVPPGIYRAVGHTAPGHKYADWRLKWREWRMSLGYAPEGSSPAEQERLGLNRDATLQPGRSEGDKRRG